MPGYITQLLFVWPEYFISHLFACTRSIRHMCGGQSPTCRNLFSPSTVWVLVMRLGGKCLNPHIAGSAANTLKKFKSYFTSHNLMFIIQFKRKMHSEMGSFSILWFQNIFITLKGAQPPLAVTRCLFSAPALPLCVSLCYQIGSL